jgi:hypothetical protein
VGGSGAAEAKGSKSEGLASSVAKAAGRTTIKPGPRPEKYDTIGAQSRTPK